MGRDRGPGHRGQLLPVRVQPFLAYFGVHGETEGYLITTIQEEQYSDDLNLMTTDMTTLIANLGTLDDQAAEYGVVYDMKKEHYLTINKQGGRWHTTAITQPPYSWAKKHTSCQGLRLLGAQVWPLASHDLANAATHAAIAYWNSATWGSSDLALLATAYTEDVQSVITYHSATNAPADDELHKYDQKTNATIKLKIHLGPRASATHLRNMLLHSTPHLTST